MNNTYVSNATSFQKSCQLIVSFEKRFKATIFPFHLPTTNNLKSAKRFHKEIRFARMSEKEKEKERENRPCQTSQRGEQ
jgi:uncharacterized protein YccT (UPF0319 family)